MPMDFLDGWKIIAKSVRGPTHVRSGVPNQDDVEYDMGKLVVAAVSDGHGSSKCFRSDRGSQLATETAIEVVEDFFGGDWESLSPRDRQHQLEDRLPKRIVSEWRNKVRHELTEFPLSVEEQEKMATFRSAGSKDSWDEIPYVVYGATLLTVVITGSFVVYLQLGDGDILTVLDSGDVDRPLPNDDRHIGNETTSLSSEKAAYDFRVVMKSSIECLPSLILMATDGYSNSFKDDDSFRKTGSDFCSLLASPEGISDVKKNLEEWLTESAKMSGDDVTLCLLYREINSALDAT
jgi:serine/threonine protein phosphatase PrpC